MNLTLSRPVTYTPETVTDKVVRLASARGWLEEDAVQEVEKQRVEAGNLSLDALAKHIKARR